MKKLNTSFILLISALFSLSTIGASAQTNEDNWVNSEGLVWKSGDGTLCWRNHYWTPATTNSDCNSAVFKKTKLPPSDNRTPAVAKMTFSADTFFDFDKATLKPAGKQTLDELALHISTLDTLEVIVATGHTDSVGADAYNMRLSLHRAEAVKAYLVNKGIPAKAIYVEGKGQTDPVATNKTHEGRAQNRRVEIEGVGFSKNGSSCLEIKP